MRRSIMPRGARRRLPRAGGTFATALLIAAALGSQPASGSPRGQGALAAALQGATRAQPTAQPTAQPYLLFGVDAISASDAWRVGDKRAPARFGSSVPVAQHWDGTSWNAVHVPAQEVRQGTLVDVAHDAPDDVWAVGFASSTAFNNEPLVERWNGSAWHPVAPPDLGQNGGTLRSVDALSATDIWAVGSEDVNPEAPQAVATQWDGSAWTVTLIPQPGHGVCWSLGVSATSDTDVWVAGSCEFTTGYAGFVDHWDGSSWTLEPTVPGDEGFRDVVATAPDDVWVVGDYAYGHPILVQHWDGAAWSVFSLHRPAGASAIRLNSVDAVSATDVWAVGSYVLHRDGPETTLILHWDGATWARVPSHQPDLDNFPHAISADSADDAWLVGGQGRGRGGYAEHWDGHRWTPSA